MIQGSINDFAGEILILSRPMAGERIIMQYTEGARVLLDFPPSEAVMDIHDRHLAINFADGGEIIVRDFFAGDPHALPWVILLDGRELTGEEFLEEFDEALLRTFVRIWEHGIGQYRDDPGEPVHGIDRLGSLLTIYWSPETEDKEIYQGLPATWLDTPSPGHAWNGSFMASLYEDNMPEQNIYERGTSPVLPGRIMFDPDLESGVSVTSIRLSGFPPGTLLYDGDPTAGGVLLIPDADGVYTLTLEQLTVTGAYVTPPVDPDADMPSRE